MHEPTLQLMVHGIDIADAKVRLNYPGVTIISTSHGINPNYLFIDLKISPQAKPGVLDLLFQRDGVQLHRAYQLQQRQPGSAQRQGFSSKDAILNLMPDRFAQGQSSTVAIPGFTDVVDRANGGARHGGDIKGIVDHLDYIANMGFTMIWPTPMLENRQNDFSYHGYAMTDLYRIDPRFGSNEEYREMVRSARAHGLGIIQDIVPNHIGDNHWWMKDMPAPDWLTYSGNFIPTRHARSAISDQYASQEDRANFTQGWFSSTMPDLNQKNPHVALYEIQQAIWWIEYAGLSGLRVDTYGYSDTAFLAKWSRRIMQEYPYFTMVGEEWSSNPLTVAYWLKGKLNKDGYVSSMPSMMDFPLVETLRRALVNEETFGSGFTELYSAMSNDQLYPHPEAMVLFEGNHDMPRLFSVLDNDIALYKMAAVYVATMPRTPQFYYGTEVLMSSPKERDDAGARQDFPGGWAGDKVNAFTGQGLTDQQLEAQTLMRQLLNWRKGAHAIHSGRLMHYAPDNGVYAYFRYDDRSKYMIVLNKNYAATTLPLKRFHEMLNNKSTAIDVLSGKASKLGTTMIVPPRAALILQLLP